MQSAQQLWAPMKAKNSSRMTVYGSKLVIKVQHSTSFRDNPVF